MSDHFCQCLAPIEHETAHCNTVGCSLSTMPPQFHNGELVVYPDGLIRPSVYIYSRKPIPTSVVDWVISTYERPSTPRFEIGARVKHKSFELYGTVASVGSKHPNNDHPLKTWWYVVDWDGAFMGPRSLPFAEQALRSA